MRTRDLLVTGALMAVRHDCSGGPCWAALGQATRQRSRVAVILLAAVAACTNYSVEDNARAANKRPDGQASEQRACVGSQLLLHVNNGQTN
jgi:hypothetical protein